MAVSLQVQSAAGHDGVKEHDKPIGPLMHGAAGVLGGSIATAIFYPLDFLRTRMHTYRGGNTYPLRSARQIIREEGLTGVYRGITVSIISHSLGWGMYLMTFRTAQQKFFGPLEKNLIKNDTLSDKDTHKGSATCDFMSACVASIITGTMITPLNMIKTRRQLYDVRTYHKPRGFFSGLKAIVTTEGLSTLFRGVGPQILLTGSTTIQVTLYEGIKREIFSDNNNPTSLEVALASAVSKATASTICNPLEVVRTRLQDKRNRSLFEYRSMSAALCTIWRTEGVLGLYRGLPVNICRVIPSTVMAFVLYEKCLAAVVALNSMARPLQR
ncbi:putative mitochondrial carrier protein [Trypanosoma theileri]|uniref:Putative mitochondrial carrier protein n=1 Tax=Trypanosoma theileri TaxID=67003 RepID=A0A1X0P6S2_9TRYP|nr:putative mitochondrial carrier protein [Trypanosoma theileri]ORC92130.1 putative mitochondrial carrier protein [Trypanosoma theileri]